MQSFLADHTQRLVVVLNECSVTSDVPQVSVLGSILFLVFIKDKDIASSIHSSIRLFTDDCLLYRQIDSIQAQETIQQDLNTLVDWAETWGMAFHVKKCNVLSVTLRTKTKRTYTYKMNGEKVAGIRDTKYLGVTLNSKLTWDTHIWKISTLVKQTEC